MKKIATDIDSFEKLRNKNNIYVDKTKYLYKLIQNGTYYFLSRPRRFGKSLFLDTVKSFYQGKKELFKNLYIYDQDIKWQKNPIIVIDFNKIPAENRKILDKSLQKELKKIADKYNIDLQLEEAYYMFPILIENLAEKFNKNVVVLIDEYDKPIISNLSEENGNNREDFEIARENQKFLKIFYDNLKALGDILEFVFITGVSKFSKVSIFSTLNNLIELDMHPKFSHMLGYTDKELKNNFDKHFQAFARKKNISKKELYKEFKAMYNGFRFSDEDVRVYNPYSIAKALDSQKIDNYWFESGTPKFLIDLIREKDFDIPRLENIEVVKSKLKAYDIKRLHLIPLLFQTGYLTIQEIEDEKIYHLSYPNYEVEAGLTQNILDELTEYEVEL